MEDGSPEIRTQDQSVKSRLYFPQIPCTAMVVLEEFLKKSLKTPAAGLWRASGEPSAVGDVRL